MTIMTSSFLTIQMVKVFLQDPLMHALLPRSIPQGATDTMYPDDEFLLSCLAVISRRGDQTYDIANED